MHLRDCCMGRPSQRQPLFPGLRKSALVDHVLHRLPLQEAERPGVPLATFRSAAGVPQGASKPAWQRLRGHTCSTAEQLHEPGFTLQSWPITTKCMRVTFSSIRPLIRAAVPRSRWLVHTLTVPTCISMSPRAALQAVAGPHSSSGGCMGAVLRPDACSLASAGMRGKIRGRSVSTTLSIAPSWASRPPGACMHKQRNSAATVLK